MTSQSSEEQSTLGALALPPDLAGEVSAHGLVSGRWMKSTDFTEQLHKDKKRIRRKQGEEIMGCE